MSRIQSAWRTKDVRSARAHVWSVGDTIELTVDLVCAGVIKKRGFLMWKV